MTAMIRVRFAPSPTGSPHIGNIRTAVFDWLFARHEGGVFILRIEDTDRARLVPGAMEEIMRDLRWAGLDWDEGPEVGGPYGPYIQSERVDLYQKHAEQLVAEGRAYHCYCTAERLEEMRKAQQAAGKPTGYDQRCRYLTEEERAALASESDTFVIRFAMPTSGQTSFVDVVRGELSFDNALQDDFVILKSDGYPTYHFASVVDDHLIKISHVIRSEEWISSTPKHVQLYSALGWEPPAWVHPSLILGPDRSKLSKRHGAVNFSTYIEEGYLPDAMVNYLALLGWSAGEDRDIYSIQELIEKFTLEGITGHPAIFDAQKLLWMNGVYIRQTSMNRLAELILPYLQKAGLVSEPPSDSELDYVRKIVPLIQDRLKVLSEAPELAEFFFREEPAYDPKAVQKWLERPEASELLTKVVDRLEELEEWNVGAIESAVREAGADVGAEGGKVIHPVRVASTGRTVGPGLFETLEVLGRDRVVTRLRRAGSSEQ
ncbi:MAG: glutamate--tRNA ligase [Armatimonadetes bacterium]|nr:glutamate--tRNA ligase [Armatimonadota bacterium]